MKIKNHLLTGLALLSPLALQSCFDNDYDLSDIDTTVRLQTTDLVVPLNIDVLTLDQVMDIDDDSEIVKDTDPNGNVIYAIKKEGTFDSDPINVASFTVEKPNIKETSSDLTLEIMSGAGNVTGRYPIISEEPASFNSTATDIDESIHEIKALGVETKFTVVLRLNNLSKEIIDNMTFEGVKLKFPAGLHGSHKGEPIDSETGTLDLSKKTFTSNANGEVHIDVDIYEIEKKEDIVFDYDSHSLTFEGNIEIIDGEAKIHDVAADILPPTVQFDLQPEMDAINVNTFSGKLEYNVDDFSIDPIDLNSLPDFLNQSGTNIILENPQIYLSVTNPMDVYGVYFQTGFELTANRDGNSKTYGIDKGTFQTPKTTDPKHQFVLAPQKPAYYYQGYASPEWVKFTGLKSVLSGLDGMPTTIEVNAIDPKMPIQDVEDFRLGEELSPIDGSYAFYAPLQLSKDSHIAYTDTIDGWNDEDVDALTISKIVVNFDASTDLPYDIDLTIIPITFEGKDIPNVERSTVRLQANAKDRPVELSIIGTIEHLDGIKLKANVISQSSNVMRPDMKLYIKNSKITLTGYYEKEL